MCFLKRCKCFERAEGERTIGKVVTDIQTRVNGGLGYNCERRNVQKSLKLATDECVEYEKESQLLSLCP